MIDGSKTHKLLIGVKFQSLYVFERHSKQIYCLFSSLASLQQFFIDYQKEFVFGLVWFTPLCNWLLQNLGHFLNHRCLTPSSQPLVVFQVSTNVSVSLLQAFYYTSGFQLSLFPTIHVQLPEQFRQLKFFSTSLTTVWCYLNSMSSKLKCNAICHYYVIHSLSVQSRSLQIADS